MRRELYARAMFLAVMSVLYIGNASALPPVRPSTQQTVLQRIRTLLTTAKGGMQRAWGKVSALHGRMKGRRATGQVLTRAERVASEGQVALPSAQQQRRWASQQRVRQYRQRLTDAFSRLGLDPQRATTKDLTKIYRSKALEYHPDRLSRLSPADQAVGTARFKELGGDEEAVRGYLEWKQGRGIVR